MKKDLTQLLSDTRRVVVVDDNPEVWRDDDGGMYDGVLECEPFVFFERSSPSGGASDGALERMAEVLEEVHKRFYGNGDDAVGRTVRGMKLEVLAGCYIVCTESVTARRIREFGGKVLCEFEPWATHVVAARCTTAVSTAMDYAGVLLVSPWWVLYCVWRFRREGEEEFALWQLESSTSGPLERWNPPGEDEGFA